jgi:hypothetical protein
MSVDMVSLARRGVNMQIALHPITHADAIFEGHDVGRCDNRARDALACKTRPVDPNKCPRYWTGE